MFFVVVKWEVQHIMSTSSQTDAAHWDCDQVKYWLMIKGMPMRIQNIFHSKQIDGETLMSLTSHDIDNLLSFSSVRTPFGIQNKLKKYVARLQLLKGTNNPQTN